MYFKGVKISFTFGFFAIWAWLAAADGTLAAMTLLSCLLHEGGHILVMKLLDIKIISLRFCCCGITLNAHKPMEMYGWRAYPALAAGSGVNFIAFAVFLPVCRGFAMINLALALFNLMPLSFLDGGMMISAFLRGRVYGAEQILRVGDVVGCAAAAVVFLLGNGINATLPLTAVLCLWDRCFDKIIKNG